MAEKLDVIAKLWSCVSRRQQNRQRTRVPPAVLVERALAIARDDELIALFDDAIRKLHDRHAFGLPPERPKETSSVGTSGCRY